jgi:hypothetical protein
MCSLESGAGGVTLRALVLLQDWFKLDKTEI